MGNVLFWWNKGRRPEINLGSKTNQIFVQIPTARLKDRISQVCERHGIRFMETEESYTSKASFLDADELPTFGAKPEGWKESGRRVISIPVAPELLLTVECWLLKEGSKNWMIVEYWLLIWFYNSDASGVDIKGRLYCSKDGFKINAGCNGAANILPKVSATLGLFIEGVSTGALISTSEGSYLDSSRIPVYERAGSFNNR